MEERERLEEARVDHGNANQGKGNTNWVDNTIPTKL